MQAYKFDIRISEGGSILLPLSMPDLYGKEVELFIIPKDERPQIKKQASAKHFVDRWAGFLKDTRIDPEREKFDYLSDKYK